MSDDSGTSAFFSFFHIIYIIVIVCMFWERKYGEIYIWEFFMVYVWSVIIPMSCIGIIILIVVIIANV